MNGDRESFREHWKNSFVRILETYKQGVENCRKVAMVEELVGEKWDVYVLSRTGRYVLVT